MSIITKRKFIYKTPTLDTNAYANADQMGSLMTLTQGLDYIGTAFLESIVIIDKDKQNKGFTILFFNAAPTIASSDNGALDITDAEMASKFIGQVSFATADFKSINASSIASAKNVGLNLFAQSSGTVTALMMADEAQTRAADGLVLGFGLRFG